MNFPAYLIVYSRSTAYLETILKTFFIREGLQFLQSELPVIELSIETQV